jgi:cyclopropane-fatty-acyl-phospholipid synthase
MVTTDQHRPEKLRPFYEQVRAHYDISDDFFALFLDPSRTYSCAYFAGDDMTLEEAQRAKIDLTLGKLDLRPGARLLDVGCGWGAMARRAAEQYGARVTGLTLSANQHAYVTRSLAEHPVAAGSVEVRLQGWEDFDEPVDRVVSVGAFEHFRAERYAAFFDRCRALLPADGRMVLHTIVWPSLAALERAGKSLEHEHVLFGKFVRKHIFPGGQLCPPETVMRHAEQAGFSLARAHSLQPHYARTLEKWAANLCAARDRAVALTSPETYDIHMRYLTGCARLFASGNLDVIQFSLAPAEGLGELRSVA